MLGSRVIPIIDATIPPMFGPVVALVDIVSPGSASDGDSLAVLIGEGRTFVDEWSTLETTSGVDTWGDVVLDGACISDAVLLVVDSATNP